MSWSFFLSVYSCQKAFWPSNGSYDCCSNCTVIAILYPDRKVWAALYGIVISIIDSLVLDKLQKDWKKEAAKIQERFDCELFELDWNDFKVGDKPAPESIHKSSQSVLKKSSNVLRLKDWYSPNVGELPLHLARIACQRSNIYWDSQLRRVCAAWITGITIAGGIIAVAVGLALKLSIEASVLSILAPLSPTFLWSIREVKRQKESATTLDRLMKYAQQLWKDAVQGKLPPQAAKDKSRRLQDELFYHRHSNQPIFNWIYKLSRKTSEAQMHVGARELVLEALQAKDNQQ